MILRKDEWVLEELVGGMMVSDKVRLGCGVDF